MPGFKVLGTVRKLGIRGSTQAELLYENLEVPADHVLGTVGKGFTVAVHVLNAGRLTLAAGCTSGAKKTVLDEMATIRRAARAVRPSARAFRDHAAQAVASRRRLRTRLTRCSECLPRSPINSEADFSLEAACAKVFASELIWNAADEMVQVAGGRGFVKPYPYERMLRDSRINRIFEGANEVLRLFIALNGIQGPAESLKEVGTALRTAAAQSRTAQRVRDFAHPRACSAQRHTRREASSTPRAAQVLLREACGRAESRDGSRDHAASPRHRRPSAGARAARQHGDRAARHRVRDQPHTEHHR